MVGGVGEARAGQAYAGSAAALLVHAQGVGAGPGHRDPVVDQERHRRAHARDLKLVFAGGREAAEVGDIDLLVGERAGRVPDILRQRKRALEHHRVGVHVDDVEARLAGTGISPMSPR